MKSKPVDLEQQWREFKKSIIRLVLAVVNYLWVTGLYKQLAKFAYMILDKIQPAKVRSA